MSGKPISKKVFEAIVKHLIDMEERKIPLLDRYYPDITKEREELRALLDGYISKVEENISTAKVTEQDTCLCPFIIIGSVVELENMNDGEIEKYRIISPYENSINTSMDFASFLSPVGKALLLKEAEEQINISSPIGGNSYRIKSISIPEDMFYFNCKDD